MWVLTPACVVLQVAQQFLDKSDGRDKLLATVQYLAMFISAGQNGDVKKVQASVAAARKVFRVLKPLETLNPLIQSPGLNPNRSLALELLNKLKSVLMAVYFGGDNIVWASQAGILSNKTLIMRAQKASLYGWGLGSVIGVITELYDLQMMTVRREGETQEQYQERVEKNRAEITRHLLVLIHSLVQALLATGLLELRPWKTRSVGALGVVASALNCYLLYPPAPSPVAAAKPLVKTA